jgi:hypothetical protein
MIAPVLYLFFIYPFTLLTVALHSPWIVAAGTVLFLMFLVGFDRQMKRALIRELHAQLLPEEHSRVVTIRRMIEAYAPDDFRVKARVRIYVYPNAEPELRLWMPSKWRFDLFISEGFFDRSRESDWMHFLHSWSTLKHSSIRRQNRLRALNALFDRWKGPPSAFRHWWVSFWLFPLERLLKISKI